MFFWGDEIKMDEWIVISKHHIDIENFHNLAKYLHKKKNFQERNQIMKLKQFFG